MRILIADANSWRAERVEQSLAVRWPDAQYVRATDGGATIRAAFRADLDLIVLDPRLSYSERRQLLRDLRRVSGVATVLLLNVPREVERVELAKLGAIDYVVSPFCPVELIARAEAAIQMQRTEAAERAAVSHLRWSDGYLTIDFARGRAWVNRMPTTLAPADFRLLAHLALHPGRYFSEPSLLRLVLGKGCASAPGRIDVFLRRLREQIEVDSEAPRYLVEDRELGYRFVRATPLGRTHWEVGSSPGGSDESEGEVARVLSFAARAERKPRLLALAGEIRDSVIPPPSAPPGLFAAPRRAALALVQ